MNSLILPLSYQKAVTPSNTVLLPDGPCSTLYIGSTAGGTGLVYLDMHGNTVTLTGLVAGTVYPFRALRVNSTGTTVTSIVAGYNAA